MSSKETARAYLPFDQIKNTRGDIKNGRVVRDIRNVIDDDSDDDDDDDKSSTRTSTQSTSQKTSFVSTTSITLATVTSRSSLLTLTSSSPLLPSTSATQTVFNSPISQVSSISSSPISAIAATSVPIISSPPSTRIGTKAIVLSAVAAGAGTAIIIFLVFFIYKTVSRRRKSTTDIAGDSPEIDHDGSTALNGATSPRRPLSQASRNLWGSRRLDPVARDESTPSMMYSPSAGGVSPQDRPKLTRSNLLRSQERDGGSEQVEWPLRTETNQRKTKSETSIEDRKTIESEEQIVNPKPAGLEEKEKLDIEAGGK